MGEREFVLFMALVSAMAALAIDIMPPAFAEMRRAFGLDADSTRLSLTITLFLMGTGVGNLFYGPIADAVGRKPTLAGSMALYGAAALTAALAPSLGVLYASRFVWGFAAGGSRTLTQAIVRDRFAGTAMARVMTLISAFGVVAAMVALGGNRLLHRVQARQLALGAGVAFTAASAALFAVTLAGGGLPPFGVWLVLFSLANACHVAVFPTGMSLALEPMGEMAGTAAAVLGFIGSLGGSLLASFTDRAIDGSVMPIGIAYIAYGSIALAWQLWARGAASSR